MAMRYGIEAASAAWEHMGWEAAWFSDSLTRSQHAAVATGIQVRRLTPVECERLQGFPDGWTDVPHRGKPASDSPRYKALGNSMAVPVMRWIGERINDYTC